jgi:predicted kinase
VDATNLKASLRRPYGKIADKHGAKEVLVRVTAPARVIRERLARRSTDRDADDRSTADAEVYEKMLADVEPLPQKDLRVDTSRDVGAALDKVAALLQS